MAMSLIICWATKDGNTLSWLSTPTQSLRTWCGFDQIWKTKADENYHRQEQLFLSLVLFLSPEPRLQRPGCQLLKIWSNASFTFSSPRRLFSGRARWGTGGRHDDTWGVLGLWPWHMQLDTKYPGRCIPECQGHLVAHLGVQAKPVDAQVEHGEGADGGDWIAANVVHDH